MRVRFLTLALATACLVSPVVAAGWTQHRQASSDEPLQVRFYDPYRLVSREVRERLQREAVTAFEQGGVILRFVNKGGRGVLPATLYPELPEHWAVHPSAIGVAIGADGDERRSVFLSLGATERALGLRRSERGLRKTGNSDIKRTKLQTRQLGTALGRVLAHELTHTIAPECPHTHTGLMAATLSRRMLTAPGVTFDELAAHHLREGAAAFLRDVAAATASDASQQNGAL